MFMNNRRNDEFVGYVGSVGMLQARLRVRFFMALAQRDGMVRLFYPIPALVAVHGVIPAADRRDFADTQLGAFVF